MLKHHSLDFNFKLMVLVPALTFNFDPKVALNKCYQLEQTIYILCTLPLCFKFPRPLSNVPYTQVIRKKFLQCIL